MRSKTFVGVSLIFVFIITTLACSTISNVGKQISGAKETAQAVVTQGQGLVTQIQGFATAVGTVQAIVTEQGPSLIATAQAFVTENPGLVQTGVAVLTQSPGLIETGQAALTENPGILQTAQAAVTQGFGAAPTDIPVLPTEQITNYVGTKGLVSYSTKLDLMTVVEFYKTEMPKNGWEASTSGDLDTDQMVLRGYVKPGLKATVTILINPLDNSVVVTVMIQSQ